MMRAVLLSLALVACGSSPKPVAKTAVEPQVASTGEAVVTPSGAIRRSEVRQAISAGLGTFLQRVTFDVDHPVFRDHKFVGFKILSLNGPGWNNVDLKVGDVVTAVNGFTVERPEQALQAFSSLSVASELRVDYEREGVPRTFRLAITDD